MEVETCGKCKHLNCEGKTWFNGRIIRNDQTDAVVNMAVPIEECSVKSNRMTEFQLIQALGLHSILALAQE